MKKCSAGIDKRSAGNDKDSTETEKAPTKKKNQHKNDFIKQGNFSDIVRLSFFLSSSGLDFFLLLSAVKDVLDQTNFYLYALYHTYLIQKKCCQKNWQQP